MPSYNQSDQQIFETLQAAEDVAERLRALMGSLGPDFFSTQFYTRIRVKSYSSIVQKIYRKRWENEPSVGDGLRNQRTAGDKLKTRLPDGPYSFYRMTDLVGFRIVTLYDDDIKRALEHLLGFISASSGFKEALFSPYEPLPNFPLDPWDYVREAIFFRRPKIEDVEDIYVTLHDSFKTQFEKQFKSNRALLRHYVEKLHLRKPEKGDYSSVHLVLNARSTIRNKFADIPVEVQIRTASEDIWGEINHRLYYKAKDLYVWTPDLAKTYNDMSAISHRTKKALDELRVPITDFWRKSRDAENLIKEFQDPDVPYHRSIIVSLLYAISKHHIGHAEQKLRAYDDKLKLLEENLEVPALQEALCACLSLMVEVQEEFRKTRDKIAIRKISSDSFDIEMLEQRILLCSIEINRLDALAIFHYDCLIEPNGTPVTLVAEHRQRHLSRVFSQMCEHRNDSNLKLRPVAMLSYWKFLISKHIDPLLAMQHLQVAATDLVDDKSLPRWSIYHIHIRRSLAYELYSEAYRLVRGNGRRSSLQVWWRSQLAITVQDMLEQAFQLLLESYTRQLNKDERAGDLIFGYRSDEDLLDATMLAGVTSWYLYLFGRIDCRRLGTSFDFLITRMQEVRDSLRPRGQVEKIDPTGRLIRVDKLTEDIKILTTLAQDNR